MATGKTRLGSLLTFNGRAGVVIEADERELKLVTDAWLRRIEFCPRVVIITMNTCAEVLKHPRLQNLFAARASLDHNLELIQLATIHGWPDQYVTTTPHIKRIQQDRLRLERLLDTPKKRKKQKNES